MALMSLVIGLRSSEITNRVVRDVDDGGRLLWIDATKTRAGRRQLEVPALLQPYLQRLTTKRSPQERLFGRHWRDAVLKAVKRICADAGVPVISARGLRGTHATLATARGTTGHVVAAALGHRSPTTTYRSYALPEAVHAAQQGRVLAVLDGGRRRPGVPGGGSQP